MCVVLDPRKVVSDHFVASEILEVMRARRSDQQATAFGVGA